MSFQRKAKVIEFPEGHELHGLVVKARRPRIEQIEVVEGIQTEDRSAVAASFKPIIRGVFGPALISWNYVNEDGDEVPATPDGFASIDVEAQMSIINGWIDDAQVSTDLGKESDSGRSSRVPVSIPVTGTPGLSNALESLHALPASSPFSASSPATP